LEALEIAGLGIRQQYQQCMIVPENHALLPKAYSLSVDLPRD
jgi:hypothetical protein